MASPYVYTLNPGYLTEFIDFTKINVIIILTKVFCFQAVPFKSHPDYFR